MESFIIKEFTRSCWGQFSFIVNALLVFHLQVALGKFEEERKQYKQQSNEQVKQIEDFEFRVGEMQKVINLKTADVEACQKQFAEKEHLLSVS